MPKTEKEIAIYIGTFDGKDNTFTWKKDSKFDTIKPAYTAFKALCKKCVAYDYNELMKIYNSPRLDIELRQGSKMLKWFGVYEKEITDDTEKDGK